MNSRAICVCLVIVSTTIGIVPVSHGQVIPEYFGLHIHNADSGTRWPNVPFGSWRLWDAHVSWRDIQPAREKWDFTRLDRYLTMAKIAGVEVLLPLGLTPQWASSRPSEKSSYAPGNAAMPASLNDWTSFVQAVAHRYKGRIAAYEIWNEPNAAGFFSGSIDNIVALSCAAYRVIKQQDPDARVVSPAATYQAKGIAWFDQFLAAGGKSCFDIVGFHFYTLAHESPEELLPLVDQMRAVMKKHSITGRPIWNTESGWYIKNSKTPVGVPYRKLDQDVAAAYVGRALLLGRSSGIERFYWYAWDDGKLGLLDMDSGELKPAAHAFGQVARWMTGAKSLRCEHFEDSLMICSLVRANRIDWVLWRVKGQASFNIPEQWHVTASESLLDGSSTPLSKPTMAIGEMPILLTSVLH